MPSRSPPRSGAVEVAGTDGRHARVGRPGPRRRSCSSTAAPRTPAGGAPSPGVARRGPPRRRARPVGARRQRSARAYRADQWAEEVLAVGRAGGGSGTAGGGRPLHGRVRDDRGGGEPRRAPRGRDRARCARPAARPGIGGGAGGRMFRAPKTYPDLDDGGRALPPGAAPAVRQRWLLDQVARDSLRQVDGAGPGSSTRACSPPARAVAVRARSPAAAGPRRAGSRWSTASPVRDRRREVRAYMAELLAGSPAATPASRSSRSPRRTTTCCSTSRSPRSPRSGRCSRPGGPVGAAPARCGRPADPRAAPCGSAGRGQSLRSSTRSTAWSGPLRRIRSPGSGSAGRSDAGCGR
jgi:hypothetical protein